MEEKLNTGVWTSRINYLASLPLMPQLGGIVVLVLLPAVHFGLINRLGFQWSGLYTPNTSEDPSIVECACNCSGRLEPDSRHVWLDTSKFTEAAIVLTLIFALLLYEIIRLLIRLYHENSIRPHFGLTVLLSLHSMYKSYWTLVEYYNDEFFLRFYGHVIWCGLQIVQTAFLLHGCDAQNQLTGLKIVVLVKATTGRLAITVVKWFNFQDVMDDLVFFMSDILTAVVCVEEWRNIGETERRKVGWRKIFGAWLVIAGLVVTEYFSSTLLS